MTRIPAVIVDWLDSASRNGWDTREAHAAEQPAEIRTVGWLLYRDKTRIVLAHSLSNLGNALGDIVIPAACVQHLKYLRETR